jgi:lysophospholipase L1-like esterase
MKLEGKIVNFLGDSITEGFGTSDFEGAQTKRYSSLLADMYGLRANNYGVCGSRIARQQVVTEASYDRDFCLRYAEMDPEADVTFILGGTNDYGHGTAFVGRFEDRTPETFYGACHFLMRGLLERYPAGQIVFATPLHRLNETDPHGDGQKSWEGRPLRDYVQIIRQVAEYYAIPVLDLYASSGLQPEVEVLRTRYMPDGLHPNDAGHVLLARKIGRFLENL